MVVEQEDIELEYIRQLIETRRTLEQQQDAKIGWLEVVGIIVGAVAIILLIYLCY